MMPDNLQSVIERVIAGSRDEADLRLIAAALQTGQLMLATGDRSVAIDGNVSNTVIVTGDNNQVILLPEEIAISLERILQQWQPKQGQYVQPKGCQRRKECDRYLEAVLQRLERLGSPEILRDEVYKGRRFNYIVRMVDFEPGLGMRGEAFFLFSEFAFINLNVLKPFCNESSQWARKRVNPLAAGQAFYNFRMPTHLCFAVVLVDHVEETVAIEIQTINPFGHRVDLLWYKVPVVYELSQQRLLYNNKASSFWENFRGEVIWQPLRTVVQQVLVPQ